MFLFQGLNGFDDALDAMDDQPVVNGFDDEEVMKQNILDTVALQCRKILMVFQVILYCRSVLSSWTFQVGFHEVHLCLQCIIVTTGKLRRKSIVIKSTEVF